jgi:hypothetical protein
MDRFIADLEEGEANRWGSTRTVYLDGRLYSDSILREGDNQPRWLRLMKEVRACLLCRSYVDCSNPHEQSCSVRELERIQELGLNGP